MVNKSLYKYNNTESPETYAELMRQSDKFAGNTLGLSIVGVIWVIAFYSLANYPNLDALKASTWVAWLTSFVLSLMGVVSTGFTFLMFLMVSAMTAYSAMGQR